MSWLPIDLIFCEISHSKTYAHYLLYKAEFIYTYIAVDMNLWRESECKKKKILKLDSCQQNPIPKPCRLSNWMDVRINP